MRGADDGRADAVGRLYEAGSATSEPRPDCGGEQRPEIAIAPRLAPIEIFGDAAREADLVDRAALAERIEPQQRCAAGTGRAAADRLEQPVRHAGGEGARIAFAEPVARLEREPELRGKAPSGLLDADDMARSDRAR